MEVVVLICILSCELRLGGEWIGISNQALELLLTEMEYLRVEADGTQSFQAVPVVNGGLFMLQSISVYNVGVYLWR